MYRLYVKSGIGFLVVASLIAPIFGEASAKMRNDYQICSFDNNTYAVIIETGDSFLVQDAIVENDQLIIYTDHYMYLDKQEQGMMLVYKVFEDVALVSS